MLEHHHSRIFKETKLETSWTLIKLGAPQVVTSVTSFLFDTISLYFVGHLNIHASLAAIGFSLAMIDAFGIAVIFGLCAAFSTLASQAAGARKWTNLGSLYNKITVLTVFVVIVLSVVFYFFTASLLDLWGFNPTLIPEIEKYVRALIPSMLGHAYFNINRFYLLAVGHFTISAWTGVIVTFLHYFWCWFFLEVQQTGPIGVCYARVITEFSSGLILDIYDRIVKPCPSAMSVSFRSRKVYKDFFSFSAEIFFHATTVYIETVTFQITAIITGALKDDVVLAAHTTVLNFLYVAIMPRYGVSLTLNSIVGNASGEMNIKKAKQYTYVGMLVNYLQGILMLFFILIANNGITRFYTYDTEVGGIMEIMLRLYCIGLMADAGSNTLAFALRALGNETYVFKSYCIAFYLIAIPGCLVLSIVADYGFYGIWSGLIAGYWAMMIFMSFKLWKLDWYESMKIVHQQNMENIAFTGADMNFDDYYQNDGFSDLDASQRSDNPTSGLELQQQNNQPQDKYSKEDQVIKK